MVQKCSHDVHLNDLKGMRLAVLSLILLSVVPFHAGAMRIPAAESIVLSFPGFSLSLPDAGFSYSGPGISYAGIEDGTFLGTVENPYGEDADYGFFPGSPSFGGRKGAMFSLGGFEGMVSSDGMQVLGLSYSTSLLDVALLYRNREGGGDEVIVDYRAERLVHVLSFGLMVRPCPYAGIGMIASFSPLLGPDLFVRGDFSFRGIGAGIYYGNSFGRVSGNEFAVRLSVETDHAGLSFFLLYGGKPRYSGRFRPFEGRYDVELEIGGVRLRHEGSVRFPSDAKKKVVHEFSISFSGIGIGIGTGFRPIVRVVRENLEIGCGKNGVYVEYSFSDRISVRLDQNGPDITFSLEFP